MFVRLRASKVEGSANGALVCSEVDRASLLQYHEAHILGFLEGSERYLTLVDAVGYNGSELM